MQALLSLALFASGALAAERLPFLVARQSSDCAANGLDTCGFRCIYPGYECCEEFSYGCEPGTYCDVNGCCEDGEVCSGGGGVDTIDITSTTTITSEITVTNTLTEDETTTITTTSRPVIPTPSDPSLTSSETPSQSTPAPPEFTGGQSSLRPAVGAIAGLVAGVMLL
ncbi:hypothetical protein BJX63DRAFT_430830 [Aspergillus granulosus]|uniref:GPI anchored serine-threonine rich protein n=1 Tax=Aspergillus granulosus TaxID=176169 RepID=A0ABR4HIT4_9EURO